MALIRSSDNQYFHGVDKQNKIYNTIDKLLLLFPDYEHFQLNDFLIQIEPDFSERWKLSTILPDIRISLLREGYIAHPPGGNAVFVLTEKGLKAKLKGGHYKYVNSIKSQPDWLKVLSTIAPYIYGTITVIFLYLNYRLLVEKNEIKAQNESLIVENKSLLKKIDSLKLKIKEEKSN